MISRWTAVLLAGWLWCVGLSPANADDSVPTTPHPLSVRQIAEKALPSVVTITTRDQAGQPFKQGSGFVIDKNCVVTNIHVIQSAGWVSVTFHDGRAVYAAGIAAADPDHDLAVIQVDTESVKPLGITAEADVHVGDEVVALGSPKGLNDTVSTGIVSAIRVDGDLHVIQTTAPVSHGSSGGPLLDDGGSVIGVTSYVDADGQNLNFAYSSRYLTELLHHRQAKPLPWDTFKAIAPAEQAPDSPAPAVPSPETPKSHGHSAPKTQPTEPAPGPGKPGMVWVNLTTGVYHMPGSRYYGKTKHGKYMTEAAAKAKGYRRAQRE